MKTLLGTEGGTERVIFQVGHGFYFTVKAFGWRLRFFALGRGLKLKVVRMAGYDV